MAYSGRGSLFDVSTLNAEISDGGFYLMHYMLPESAELVCGSPPSVQYQLRCFSSPKLFKLPLIVDSASHTRNMITKRDDVTRYNL